MIFAIEEINRSGLLPNISIGYKIFDSCGSTLASMRSAMGLINGQERTAEETCSGHSGVQAIIGESESSSTIVMSRATGPFRIPVVKYSDINVLLFDLFIMSHYHTLLICLFLLTDQSFCDLRLPEQQKRIPCLLPNNSQ